MFMDKEQHIERLIEELDTIAAASRRVADHPKVTSEDRTAIQTSIGQEFAAFVAFDQDVHAAAIELVDAATDGATIADLLATYVRIQDGCVGCHDRFRARVTAARVALEGSDR